MPGWVMGHRRTAAAGSRSDEGEVGVWSAERAQARTGVDVLADGVHSATLPRSGSRDERVYAVGGRAGPIMRTAGAWKAVLGRSGRRSYDRPDPQKGWS
ncbi:hypothetical protein GCM10022384_04160 [Streptomyces marokkonensis]|uniref:Uncharacterized protein n=1 Tax=Streptomyces marokkonensis TaxID=324855 RepID=A0ABP7NTR1_9ACTN